MKMTSTHVIGSSLIIFTAVLFIVVILPWATISEKGRLGP